MYSRLTVPLVPSTDTRLVFERAQAGLMAGTVPTKGTWYRSRRCDITSVEAVLQAITTRSGACAAINSPISGTTRAMICLLAVVAVGKERIVGDIDIVRVGPRRDDLTQHREAAKAGIEHQNRRSR